MFSFAHISDLHISPMPNITVKNLMNKRILGYLSWQYKRKHSHKMQVLEALREDIISHNLDHVCITGDLTNIALPREFVTAANWLKELGDVRNISLIPGNHDAYVKAGETLIHDHFAPWMQSDDGHTGFPFLHIRDKIAFIGLSSAVATFPFIASGKLGKKQIQALKAMLARLDEKILLRVIMIHHPPQPFVLSWRKALIDLRDFNKILADYDATIILHGHMHRPRQGVVEYPNHTIPVFGAGSASSNGENGSYPAHYHIFYTKKTANEFVFDVKHRYYNPKDKIFSDFPVS